jgi:hypothetical protein
VTLRVAAAAHAHDGFRGGRSGRHIVARGVGVAGELGGQVVGGEGDVADAVAAEAEGEPERARARTLWGTARRDRNGLADEGEVVFRLSGRSGREVSGRPISRAISIALSVPLSGWIRPNVKRRPSGSGAARKRYRPRSIPCHVYHDAGRR